jgi:hypothetical protein
MTTEAPSNFEIQKRTQRWFVRWRMVFVELDDGSCWLWNAKAQRYEHAPHANDYTDTEDT